MSKNGVLLIEGVVMSTHEKFELAEGNLFRTKMEELTSC